MPAPSVAFGLAALVVSLRARAGMLTPNDVVTLREARREHMPDRPDLIDVIDAFAARAEADQPAAGRELQEALARLQLSPVRPAYEFDWQKRRDING